MATTTVTVYKVPRDLSDRYQAYQLTFQIFGSNTDHAVGIASDGLYHYILTDVLNSGATGAIILKIDPTTGDEIDRDTWTGGAANKIAYDFCLRRAHIRVPNEMRHGLEGYILWDNGGTMTISKMTVNPGFNIELETFTTTVTTTARGICLRGPYLHVTHNNGGFAIWHDVYDIDTADRILQNVLVNGVNGPADKAGVVYDGLYMIHHCDPIKAFGFTNRRYRISTAEYESSLAGYADIRAVDMGTAADTERHSITWDREFIYEMDSVVA